MKLYHTKMFLAFTLLLSFDLAPAHQESTLTDTVSAEGNSGTIYRYRNITEANLSLPYLSFSAKVDKAVLDKVEHTGTPVSSAEKGQSGKGSTKQEGTSPSNTREGGLATGPNQTPTQEGSSNTGKTVSGKVAAKSGYSVIYNGPKNEKTIALTFDDGPDAKYTVQILDILKENNIKATFFVIGRQVKAYPAVLKRIAKEGHSIGNHSWDHQKLTSLSSKQLKDEVTKTDQMIKSVIGISPKLFRAPYGAVSQNVIDGVYASGHKLIGWSVDTRDWDGRNEAKIMDAVKKQVKPGGIILQHSSGGKGGNLSNTVKALPAIIAYLKQQGYRFVTVEQFFSEK